jgi:hypothetical protein
MLSLSFLDFKKALILRIRVIDKYEKIQFNVKSE